MGLCGNLAENIWFFNSFGVFFLSERIVSTVPYFLIFSSRDTQIHQTECFVFSSWLADWACNCKTSWQTYAVMPTHWLESFIHIHQKLSNFMKPLWPAKSKDVRVLVLKIKLNSEGTRLLAFKEEHNSCDSTTEGEQSFGKYCLKLFQKAE